MYQIKQYSKRNEKGMALIYEFHHRHNERKFEMELYTYRFWLELGAF